MNSAMDAEVVAIQRFVLNCTAPLLLEQGERVGILGTGTFFTVGGRFFVITASHLFGPQIDPNNIGLPLNLHRADIVTLGPATIHSPKESGIDVSVIELKNERLVSDLTRTWRFTSAQNIGRFKPTQTTFLVAGYPDSQSSVTPEWIRSEPATFLTSPLKEVPTDVLFTDPFDPAVDLLFRYGRVGEHLDGATVVTPDLGGMSGASIWAFEPEVQQQTLWQPDSQVKIVGIQSGFVHGRCVLAKNWGAVAVLFGNIDEALGREVQEAYFGDA